MSTCCGATAGEVGGVDLGCWAEEGSGGATDPGSLMELALVRPCLFWLLSRVIIEQAISLRDKRFLK
jgi:hypothetical protein